MVVKVRAQFAGEVAYHQDIDADCCVQRVPVYQGTRRAFAAYNGAEGRKQADDDTNPAVCCVYVA